MKGGDHPIHKAQPGGWSQRRHQQRVDATWEQNADEVAAEVVRLAERIDARLVLVTGDVRAVKLLSGSLPDEVRALVREVEGSRADDGSELVREDEVDRCLATAVAAETADALQKLKEERGQATGPAPVSPPPRPPCRRGAPACSWSPRRWRAPSGTETSPCRWPPRRRPSPTSAAVTPARALPPMS